LESITENDDQQGDIIISGILNNDERTQKKSVMNSYLSDEKLAELVASRQPPSKQFNTSHNKKKFLAYSVVGSPYYMSPEVTDIPLKSKDNVQGYGEEVDWWSLGCVFFELVVGAPAFGGESRREIWIKINNWETELPKLFDEIREALSPQFLDLLERLLCRSEVRLGRDIDEIKNHPFFEGMDWDKLTEMTPVWVPKLPSLDDPPPSPEIED